MHINIHFVTETILQSFLKILRSRSTICLWSIKIQKSISQQTLACCCCFNCCFLKSLWYVVIILLSRVFISDAVGNGSLPSLSSSPSPFTGGAAGVRLGVDAASEAQASESSSSSSFRPVSSRSSLK